MTDAPEEIKVRWGKAAGDVRVDCISPRYAARDRTGVYIREDVALAMVAAEREACAREAEDHNDEMWEYSTGNLSPIVGMRDPLAHAIRSRTPDDAKAALDAMLKAEREKALREAADAVSRATIDDGGDWPPDRPGVWLCAKEASRKSILALIEQESKE